MAFPNRKEELDDQPPPGPNTRPLVWGMCAAAAAGAVCVALWVWPGYLLARPWERPGPPPESVALFFSADVRGYLEPSGCTERERGGVARASGHLNSVKQPATRLAFDVGDMSAGPLLWQQLAWRSYLTALERMKYTAANLGSREITLSAADIRRIAAGSRVPLISANVTDSATGKPLVETHHRVVAGNLRVTAVGVVQAGAADRLGEGVAVADPHEALGELLPRLGGKTDVIVLLAACDREMMHEIARAHPEIHAILGSGVPQAGRSVEIVGGCRIACHTNEAQGLSRVDVKILPDARPDSATSAMILLDKDTPEDPAVLGLVEQYNAELARLNRQGGLKALGVPVTPPPRGANKYVGSENCGGCHTKIHDKWEKLGHSRAYQSLVRRKRENNPDCLRCHVLAFGAGDGFRGITISPDRSNVQCECCHGRGGEHVRARRGGAHKSVGRMARVQPEVCDTCHDRIHSPDFSFAAYWKRIRHDVKAKDE